MPHRKGHRHELNIVERKRSRVFREFAHHHLHSGSKHGPLVTNPHQAAAIAYAEGEKAAHGAYGHHAHPHHIHHHLKPGHY